VEEREKLGGVLGLVLRSFSLYMSGKSEVRVTQQLTLGALTLHRSLLTHTNPTSLIITPNSAKIDLYVKLKSS
jgi:hypothetical protein